jgi:hypothetical protein
VARRARFARIKNETPLMAIRLLEYINSSRSAPPFPLGTNECAIRQHTRACGTFLDAINKIIPLELPEDKSETIPASEGLGCEHSSASEALPST